MPKYPKGIYERGGILWARFKVKGVEYRESLRTRSVAVAEKRLIAVRKAIEDRVFYGAAEVKTWQEAVVEWDTWIKRQHKRESTVDRYLVSLMQLRPWLDDKELRQIDRDLIRSIVRDRAKRGTSNATIRRDLTAMSSVLDAAIDAGWIEDNAAHAYDRRRLKEKRDPIVLPQPESVARVLALKTRFTDLADFARLTGMRQEEIVSLTHAQVDRARMSVSLIKTKGRRAREVPMTPEALAVLDRQPPFLRSPFVFWHGDGERFKNVPTQFAATVRRVAQKAAREGVAFHRFTFHHLRHLFAVESLRTGSLSLYQLQQILGHSSIQTTELYLDHLTPEEKQIAMNGVAQKTAQA